jgi:thioredoxin 1
MTAKHPYIELDDKSFQAEIIKAKLPAMVDFWATWCGPCRAIAPHVEALAKAYDGKLVVGKLNIDDSPAVAKKYNVMSIPTLLFFRDGKVAAQIVGAVSKAAIEKTIAKVLGA